MHPSAANCASHGSLGEVLLLPRLQSGPVILDRVVLDTKETRANVYDVWHRMFWDMSCDLPRHSTRSEQFSYMCAEVPLGNP
jgi:hypothetical protein